MITWTAVWCFFRLEKFVFRFRIFTFWPTVIGFFVRLWMKKKLTFSRREILSNFWLFIYLQIRRTVLFMFISILCIDVHPYQYTHCFSLSLETEFKPLHWLFRLLSLTGYKGPYKWLNLRCLLDNTPTDYRLHPCIFHFYVDFFIERLSANRVRLHFQWWFEFLHNKHLVTKHSSLFPQFLRSEKLSVSVCFSTPCSFMCLPIDLSLCVNWCADTFKMKINR